MWQLDESNKEKFKLMKKGSFTPRYMMFSHFVVTVKEGLKKFSINLNNLGMKVNPIRNCDPEGFISKKRVARGRLPYYHHFHMSNNVIKNLKTDEEVKLRKNDWTFTILLSFLALVMSKETRSPSMSWLEILVEETSVDAYSSLGCSR